MAVALTATRADRVGDATADANIRRLVDVAALPADALIVLDAANPGARPLPSDAIHALIATTARILASIRRNEPVLSARAGAAS